MTNKKVTELAELTEHDINNDFLMVVDVSDTTMAASGTNKKLKGVNSKTLASNTFYNDETNNIGGTVQESITQLNEVISVIGRTDQGTWIVSGGGVQWVQDYDFDVAAVTYYILGTLYTAPQTLVELDPSDGDDDRFDAIVATSSGTIIKITGTASPNPETPSVDPSSQVVLAYVRVDATTTEPPGLQTDIIYRENVEWTTASNSGNIVANSSTDPFSGSLVVRATSAASGNAITFTDALLNATAYASLNFYIKFSAWPSAKSLNLSFINTATGVRNSLGLRPGQYGMVAGVTDYQLVSIPIQAFRLSEQIDRLEIAVAGGGAGLSFAIDNIELIALTGAPPVPNNFIESLNGLNASSQIMQVGTTGTDFNIDSRRETHTFNLPDASTSNRGAVTTGTQTLGGAKTFDKTVQVQDVTTTPDGTTATINLGNSNHQTLSLVDATGTVTVTVTPPPGISAGTIIVTQHATTVRDLTWVMGSGSQMWMGGEPDWSGDAVSKRRVVSWRWDGSTMYFAASEVNS
jgi:hypothetical protein